MHFTQQKVQKIDDLLKAELENLRLKVLQEILILNTEL